MITVLVTKPGTLTSADIDKLREVEIIVVEANDPNSVRWMSPSEIFDPTDMMRAALYSISKSTPSTKERFVDQLAIIGKANKAISQPNQDSGEDYVLP